MNYLFQEAGLFLALAYLLLIAGTSNGIVTYELTRLSVGALTVVVMAWLAATFARGLRQRPARAGGETSRARLPLRWLIALCLAVYAFTALTSIDPRRSLGDVWLTGAYVFVFVLTTDLVVWGWPRELFVKALLLAGGILIGLSGFHALNWYWQWLASAPGQWLPALAYRLPAPNTTAMFLNLLLMPALARLLAARAPVPRALLTLWVVSAFGLIFLSSSRGGWLGTVAGGGVAVWGGWRSAGARLRVLFEALHRRRIFIWLLIPMVVVIVGVTGWAAYRLMSHPSHGPLLSSRTEFWVPAWKTFLRSPWVGQGPFTFGSAYMRDNSVPPSLPFTHAHSLFFNLLAESGAAGVISFGFLLTAAIAALWRRLGQSQGDDRVVTLGALAALTAYIVHGLFDTVSAEPTNAFVVAILMGVALAPGPAPVAPEDGWAHRWPGVGLAIALVIAGGYGVWLSTPLHLGVLAANASQWSQAEAHLVEAARRDPRSAVVHQQLGLTQSVLASQSSEGRDIYLAEAVAAFERVVRLDPDWALNHANLGALYAAQGNMASALDELRAATTRAPRAAVYHLNLGAVAEATDDAAEARRAYAEALRLWPDWAEAYFWRATPFRAAFLAEWRESTPPLTTPSVTDLEAAIAGGEPYDLAYAQLAEAYLRAGRLPEAARLVQQADLAYPHRNEDKLEVLWAKAELAAARGDYESAAAFGDQAWAGFRDQSIFGPGAFGDPAYGPFLFRREAMAVDMVPQLIVIRLTDPWAERMVQLGDWYTLLGDPTRAAATYREVLTFVPDNAAAQARLRP